MLSGNLEVKSCERMEEIRHKKVIFKENWSELGGKKIVIARGDMPG